MFGFFRDDGGGEYTPAENLFIEGLGLLLIARAGSGSGDPLKVTYNANQAREHRYTPPNINREQA